MSGADHYRRAEELVEAVERSALILDNGSVILEEADRDMIGLAKVHAMLAQADFTAAIADRSGVV